MLVIMKALFDVEGAKIRFLDEFCVSWEMMGSEDEKI